MALHHRVMRALHLSDTLSFLSDFPSPEPQPGEALVTVRQAGICNTDLELVRGYMGFSGILGHEFVGTLTSLPARAVDPSGRTLEVGCRVVAEINCSPPGGPSDPALRAHDPLRTTLGIFRRSGAFADHLTVPIENLHRVPDSVSDDEAIFTEPLAAALQILEQCRLTPTDKAAVLGDGKLGLLCAQVLASGSAAQVVAIGKHPGKLALLSTLGISTRLLAEIGPQDARRFDLVVECTGSPHGLTHALSLLRPRGTLVLKSTYAPPSPGRDPHESLAIQTAFSSALTQVVIDEITVQGSRCGPFAPALRFLAERRVCVQPLIAARYPLVQGIEAFRHASTRGTLKVVLVP